MLSVNDQSPCGGWYHNPNTNPPDGSESHMPFALLQGQYPHQNTWSHWLSPDRNSELSKGQTREYRL